MLDIKITYVFHSCYVVETKNSVLIFDYYDGDLPKFSTEKTVYFFSSHSHFDHCGELMFECAKKIQNRKYIFSKDITLRPPTDDEVLIVEENEQYMLDGLVIHTFHSTDLGVAYLVQLDDAVVYHAGDLNWWDWPGETDAYNRQMELDYKNTISQIKARLNQLNMQIDLAFLPLDQRQETSYDIGIVYFMQEIEPKNVLPMHFFSENFDICKKVIYDHGQFASYKSEFIPIEKLNQKIQL